MLPFLTNADVCIPPRFESGTRFKILEAGASGTPVVSTTLGAEGLPVESGRHLLIADTPEAFAEAIVRVIRDRTLAATLSRQLKLLVKSRFGIDRLAVEGAAVLDYLKQ
jgi:polysaccharide biosynthesis protein PslH